MALGDERDPVIWLQEEPGSSRSRRYRSGGGCTAWRRYRPSRRGIPIHAQPLGSQLARGPERLNLDGGRERADVAASNRPALGSATPRRPGAGSQSGACRCFANPLPAARKGLHWCHDAGRSHVGGGAARRQATQLNSFYEQHLEGVSVNRAVATAGRLDSTLARYFDVHAELERRVSPQTAIPDEASLGPARFDPTPNGANPSVATPPGARPPRDQSPGNPGDAHHGRDGSASYGCTAARLAGLAWADDPGRRH